jgi:RNA-directed DNA polymerase
MEKVEGILARHKTTRTDELIARLNPILQEWSSSQGVIPLHQQALRAIDRKLYEKIWRWARRRHRNKTQQWILDTYFPPQGDNHQRWLCGDTRRLWRLSGDPGVRRQEGIKGALAAHDA